jgi:hypothetical protein
MVAKGDRMPNRIIRIFTLSAVSAAMAIGGLGVASASADRSHPEDGPHHGVHHCKGLKGKQKKHCEKNHHRGHHGANHS